jgi:hypothetical protein
VTKYAIDHIPLEIFGWEEFFCLLIKRAIRFWISVQFFHFWVTYGAFRLTNVSFGVALRILCTLILENAFSKLMSKTEFFQISVKGVETTTTGQG